MNAGIIRLRSILTVACFASVCVPLHAQAAAATDTSLTVSSGGQAVTTVSAGSVVKLTSAVASNGNPVTRGTVNFCYSGAQTCTGPTIVGTAQITAAGNATLSVQPAPGIHSYQAFFAGTSAFSGSASTATSLTVTPYTASSGAVATSTALSAAGDLNGYTLTATVSANSSQAATGTVNFVDLTEANSSLGSASISGSGSSFGFFSFPGSTAFSETTPIVSGDFNNDGITDLVVSSGVLLGNGDGTFRTAGTLPGPSVAAVGDFNADGNLDLVLGGIQIYLGDGTGNFTLAPASISNSTLALRVADFNNDGILDIAALNNTGNGSIFLGVGDGTFTTGFSALIADPNAGSYGSYFAGGQSSLAVGDFNADGQMDLAAGWTITGYGGGAAQFLVTFFFGDGTGNFTTSTVNTPAGNEGDYGLSSIYGATSEGMVIAASDLNGDGKTDVLVFYSFAACCPGTQNSGGSGLLNNGDGTFAIDGVYDNLDGGDPLATAILDPIGNGTSTVAVRYDQPQLGPMEGTYAPPAAISSADGYLTLPSGVGGGFVAGDFNGDGKTDIALGGPVATSIVGPLQGATAALSNIKIGPTGSGTHQLQASYTGDATHKASVSLPLQLSVPLATLTIVLTGPPTAVLNSPVTLNAAITSDGLIPSGTIFFLDSGNNVGSGTITNGAASVTLNYLTVGSHSFQAAFLGDANTFPYYSATLAVTVTPAPANLTLTTTTPAISYGGAIALTARIAVQTTKPTGSIAFQSLNSTLGTQTLDANGVATLNLPSTSISAGADAITAYYAGDSNYGAVTSAPVTITVAKATPALALTASAPAIALGGSETLTLTVPTAATGTAAFKLGSTTLGTSPIANGIATLTVAVPVAGNGSLTGTYSGDGNYSSAVSSPVVIAVTPTLSLTSAASTIYSGTTDAVTITFGTGGNSTAPTGTITMSSGSFTSAATPIVAGTAAITIPANTLPVGNDVLTASYSGDANYPAATGTLTVAVSSAPAPGFTLSSPTISVTPGATTGNTVQITLTPVTGFTGTVSLTAQVTSSPASATDPPTLSFGSTSPATITGSNPVTATLTISTTAQMTSKGALRPGAANPWGPASAGTAAACLLLLLWPRKKERSMLSALRRHLPILAMLALCLGVATACGGKSSSPVVTNPGTTAGTYAITVTGTSGSVTSSSVVTLTVQ